MSMTADDLGVLGSLAIALGVFDAFGEPNPSWFSDPEASLKTMLAAEHQRDALVAFVDEAMGGADRDTDPTGVVWLPIISLDDPHLDISITIDDSKAAGVDIGIGVAVRTTAPASASTISIPLFRAQKTGGPAVPSPFLLGQPGGRIRIGTSITVDSTPPVPGTARLGSIGIDIDVPTNIADSAGPVFGLALGGLQLPGAATPRDLRVSADGADELDDALLDLVLSLLKAQADALGAGVALQAVAGLLGLRTGDAVADFPITALPTQGVHALAAWLDGVITTQQSRHDWLGYLADLLEGTSDGDEVGFDLGGVATLRVGLRVDTGPSGNNRLTPTLAVLLGGDDARVEARADLFQVDLVTGAAVGLPALGVWAATGRAGAGNRVLDIANPVVARADTLRVGFALDVQRRFTFVLAADGVTLGTHQYPTLDLTSPDAVMDAAGNTVGDVADELLGGFGTVVRTLLGLTAPGTMADVGVVDLLADPVGAVSGYWRELIGAANRALVPAVLAELRNALADATQAATAIQGDGTPADPWRVALLGPLELEVVAVGDTLSIGLAATTRVDTLGERCTVIETRFAATLAEVDLAGRTASLVAGVAASLSARERGVTPSRVSLSLGADLALVARRVGIRLGWSPTAGLSAGVEAPDLTLHAGGNSVAIALPVIAADGSVILPAEAWDGVELLIGQLAGLVPGVLGQIVDLLGWSFDAPTLSGDPASGTRLRLADLVDDPAAALAGWLPRVVLSELGPPALRLLADLFTGSGSSHGLLAGTGHPDDPYRLALADGLPNVAVWFPPAGLEPRRAATPEALRSWRPGQPGLSAPALAVALEQEAVLADDVRQLIDGRNLAAGIEALTTRWTGSDGRILPPALAPAGVDVDNAGFAAGQLLDQLDLEDLIGRVPTTTVYVAIGAAAWPDAPAGRRIDLTAAHLTAAMFVVPAAATGDWFVALGRRTDCLPGTTTVEGSTDGTPEQAARLGRVLDALATVSTDIAVVAVAGAGHAARLAGQAQAAVTDLVTLGTPLAPIALTALTTQPTADALRLLQRLLPPVAPDPGVDEPVEDPDLALGRALVASMIELVDQPDPSAELRIPAAPLDPPRAGLTVTAVFGAVDADQVSRAVTAVVAAGLADRARLRATTELADPTGVHAGLRLVVAPSTTGSLSVDGDALVTLIGYDRAAGLATGQHLRVRLRLADRLGWLAATADAELRMVTADVHLPLDGSATGSATVTLHDARLFGQSWERLTIGSGGDTVPVLPEARTLLAMAVQRLTADAAGTTSTALAHLLAALGLTGGGAVVGDAVDQLVHDPGGLIRQRLQSSATEMAAAVAELIGPLAASVDLAARTITMDGGGDDDGRFGWHAHVTAGLGGLAGQVRFGTAASSPTGRLELALDLGPFAAVLRWHRPGGAVDAIPLWPQPDPEAIARALAAAAPSLGGHAALELMRRADDGARPVIDAALDALGLLGGTAGDAERPLRPLTGLLADPAGWLRNSASVAAEPVRIQALFDALRPLLGIGGAPGSPIPLAPGVSLAVVAAGAGARLELAVDTGVWTAPGGGADRLSAGVAVAITVGPAGPPVPALQLHVGFDSVEPGRQAVHVRLGAAGIEVFLRPTSGPDVALIPFAGLGSLAAAAQAALPFLLDRLAEIPGTVGDVVGTVGDALALRSGGPARFDGAALANWASDPVAALTGARLSIVTTGLNALAPLLDDLLPAGVGASANATTLTVTVGGFALSWNPDDGTVTLSGTGIAVPGIDEVSFTVGLSADGLEELTVTAGPAVIDAGGVTLQPFVTVAAGLDPTGGRRVVVGLAVNDTQRFAGRWLIDSHQFSFVASDGAITTAVDTTDPATVALRIVGVIADLVASVAMATDAVAELLDVAVGATTVRNLLRGVVLRDVADPANLIAGMFDPATIGARVQRLVVNLAAASLSVTFEGMQISLTTIDGVIGVQLGLTERLALVTGDVMLWLENDDSWIEGNPPGEGGLFVGVLRAAAPLTFRPVLVVNGVGLRIGKSSGPLLDFGITLDSIALHAFAALDPGGARAGGVQVQFSNLAVSAGGAKGDNGIAQGIMKDSGPTPPQPAFSPALGIQKHGSDPVKVTLRAGDGEGPWWIAIQRGFGPLYLEQIGFGVTNPQGRVERISLLMDGSLSMFGLTCAVDDLQITYVVTNGDFFAAESWAIDLAGLAISANMAGLTIAGGLLKQTTEQGIEYLGMLLARFAAYGITIYGGYGEGNDNGTKFTAFFAVGAINGPLGGPPAFFLTGIGGGFGINRKLVVPTDLSQFGNYPLIQALDIAAKPQEPMKQLRDLGKAFPMQRGTFWFAAGISFNSFALVDGIAVLAVEIGDGLDINLLGLARMALPRPQVAIVSIEIALLVRFSSSEGVMWVQGQLTDNSWLLYPDVRLTGGFAFVVWFKGEHAGEFVLTLGGYHPDFHRDGYPEVPRLGLRWGIGNYIVIKAGSYFALTSEAVMAGGDFEASATFGPAWAEVRFGAHGIVYFDPFRYQVDVYARISAGITIDTWIFGEITISISIGARIQVKGPDFYGKATFEVGPVELEVEFGSTEQTRRELLGAADFVAKYLETAIGGGALAHTVMSAHGALPAKGEDATPDGSAARPFVVVVEFGLTFTTTVPASRVQRNHAVGSTLSTHNPSKILGVAPMGTTNATPVITLAWERGGARLDFPFGFTARPFGSFPVGVWGPPQDDNNRKVPKAEMVEALNELELVSVADESPGGPEIPYHQVEIGPRRPLPFLRRTIDVSAFKDQSATIAALVTAPSTVSAAFGAAGAFLTGTATPTSLASLRGERQSPPLLGTLAEGLDIDAVTVEPGIGSRPVRPGYDHFVDAPITVGLLSGASVDLRVATPTRTTVAGSARVWRTAPPTMAGVEAQRSRSIAARLVLIEAPAVANDGRAGTLITATQAPPTATARAATAIVATAGGGAPDQLRGFDRALVAGRRAARSTQGATVAPGETAVLRMPNAPRDAGDGDRPSISAHGAPARVVTLGQGGGVLFDGVLDGQADGQVALVEIAPGTERIIVIGQGRGPNRRADRVGLNVAGLAGWHAGMQLPYAGWSSAVAPGCVVRSSGEPIGGHRQRVDAGWVGGAELAAGLSTVTTRFAEPLTTVVVILDDPAAFGDIADGRRLVLGLDGADRVVDASGSDVPPVLLTTENRSILAYDIVADRSRPVTVTVASELGWSLVGVMGSAGLSAAGALALVAARGLDAAIRPFAAAVHGVSRLEWHGATRTPRQRLAARSVLRPPPRPARRPARSPRRKRR